MKKKSSLRGRWFGNTLTIFCVLGLVCVIAITATFAGYYYSNMRSDMMSKAAQTSQFFAHYISQNYDDYYQSCVSYAQTFEMSSSMELQFINTDGVLVASSYGPWAGKSPSTSEIAKSIRQRQIEPFVGRDHDTGEHTRPLPSWDGPWHHTQSHLPDSGYVQVASSRSSALHSRPRSTGVQRQP